MNIIETPSKKADSSLYLQSAIDQMTLLDVMAKSRFVETPSDQIEL